MGGELGSLISSQLESNLSLSRAPWLSPCFSLSAILLLNWLSLQDGGGSWASHLLALPLERKWGSFRSSNQNQIGSSLLLMGHVKVARWVAVLVIYYCIINHCITQWFYCRSQNDLLTGLSWEILVFHVSAEVTWGLAWAGTFKMAQPDVWQLGLQLELLIRATPFSTWPVYGWLGLQG